MRVANRVRSSTKVFERRVLSNLYYISHSKLKLCFKTIQNLQISTLGSSYLIFKKYTFKITVGYQLLFYKDNTRFFYKRLRILVSTQVAYLHSKNQQWSCLAVAQIKIAPQGDCIISLHRPLKAEYSKEEENNSANL